MQVICKRFENRGEGRRKNNKTLNILKDYYISFIVSEKDKIIVKIEF